MKLASRQEDIFPRLDLSTDELELILALLCQVDHDLGVGTLAPELIDKLDLYARLTHDEPEFSEDVMENTVVEARFDDSGDFELEVLNT